MRKFEYCSCVSEDFKDKVPLPKRKTKLSAGYDFVSPERITIYPNQMVRIRTGIKVKLEADEYLALHIRSSLGIKHALMLPNNTGIIDADYYNNPDNEGEIIGALVNMGKGSYTLKAGEAFMQGIISKYLTADDDETETERVGGIGSTGK